MNCVRPSFVSYLVEIIDLKNIQYVPVRAGSVAVYGLV